jgi:hypothetical protein
MKAKVSYADEYATEEPDRIRELEVNTVEDLINFMIEQQEDVILHHKSVTKGKNYLEDSEYDLEIEVYNDYIE